LLHWLTPAERRGATVLAILLLVGAGRDVWRVWTMPPISTTATAYGDSLGLGSNPDSARSLEVAGPTEGARLLDLNRARIPDLEGLPGIGPVLARRILEERDRRRGFRQVEDLLGVRGIGPRLYGRLAPLVFVSRSAGGGAPSRDSALLHSAQPRASSRADSGSVAIPTSR
jgi:helix-hairpin-helix protein